MITIPTQPFDAVIIGGGAAGFFAAITAAEETSPNPIKIMIIEKASQPLGKVLVSGGGRCNVTHGCFDPGELITYYPRGAEALRGAFTRFQPEHTMAWFENHGVPLKTEPDGRVFPRSDSAKSVVNCLLSAASKAGIQIWARTRVIGIQKHSGHPGEQGFFMLQVRSHTISGKEEIYHRSIEARHVLLATGGDRYSLTFAEQLGHTIETPVPSLFTFKIDDPRLAGLAGISVPRTNLRLAEFESRSGKPSRTDVPDQQGALLITHWGLSGPAILRLSAWGARYLHTCNYQAGLIINWLHPDSLEGVSLKLREIKNNPENSRLRISAHCQISQFPLRLWKRLVDAALIPEHRKWANVSNIELQNLSNELVAGRYEILGKGLFKEEFVTCGGVHLDEIDFRTMQSKIVPGLFLAGEVLDIDGLTGGFNFQNAWTTGWLAGRALALR